MATPKKRAVAAVCGDGRLRLVEQEVPALRPGAVLVEVHASLVSPGTEVGGWRRLAAKRQNPQADAKPNPIGYSNAGVVLQAGEGVTEFRAGDRVACIGGTYALHTDYAAVPHNLCVALPERVSFQQGSYAMLAATAMHALRRAELGFGERTCVVGLGILGQLAAQLQQLAGQYVIGWDTIAFRTEKAGKWGINATATVGAEDEIEVTRRFTGGYGLDGGLIAFGGDATKAVQSLARCMKRAPDGHPMGRMVVVGGPLFSFSDHEAAGMTNIDIVRASRTGPGYHDEAWEYGPAYPPVVMRWTTRTNLELCMRLIAEGRLDVDVLTTHVMPLRDVEAQMDSALDDPDRILGVVLEAMP